MDSSQEFKPIRYRVIIVQEFKPKYATNNIYHIIFL